MRVTVSDGTLYRVQFVHSAHDPKHPIQGVPGGLRQIVDHLATSLRRRITLCELSLETPIPSVDPETNEEVVTFEHTPVGYGFSVCHYFDQFVKSVGRASAFDRALKVSGLDEQTKADLAEALGF